MSHNLINNSDNVVIDNIIENYHELVTQAFLKLISIISFNLNHYSRNQISSLPIIITSIVGIEEGFLLTNGSVLNAFGPNDSPTSSASHSYHYVNDILAT
tara:strand:- start:266 stop:565 length:300 start_codon:yes stop_codon:yes gene_type:complete